MILTNSITTKIQKDGTAIVEDNNNNNNIHDNVYGAVTMAEPL